MVVYEAFRTSTITKRSIEATLRMDAVSDGFTLNVTIVVARKRTDSICYCSGFAIKSEGVNAAGQPWGLLGSGLFCSECGHARRFFHLRGLDD
jgi:hypothetical protein